MPADVHGRGRELEHQNKKAQLCSRVRLQEGFLCPAHGEPACKLQLKDGGTESVRMAVLLQLLNAYISALA